MNVTKVGISDASPTDDVTDRKGLPRELDALVSGPPLKETHFLRRLVGMRLGRLQTYGNATLMVEQYLRCTRDGYYQFEFS